MLKGLARLKLAAAPCAVASKHAARGFAEALWPFRVCPLQGSYQLKQSYRYRIVTISLLEKDRAPFKSRAHLVN